MSLIQNNRFWLLMWWVGLCVGTSIPLIVGLVHQTSDQVFVGRIPIIAADTTAYFSQIEQARQGSWLFTNQFTSQPQHPSLFHPLWLVMGWLGAITTLSTPWVYHLARWLAIGGMVWVLWKFLSDFFHRAEEKWVALILVTTSSGLGWLDPENFRSASSMLKVPTDLWVAESNTFLSLHHSALFIVAETLLLAIIWGLFKFFEQPSHRLGFKVSLGILLVALIHPYDLVTVGVLAMISAATNMSGMFRTKKTWRVVISTVLTWGIIVLTVGTYYWRIVLGQPAMAGWLRQNIDTTGRPWTLLAGYGLLLPLAVLALWSQRRKTSSQVQMLVLWVLVVAVLIHVPYITFQRRLLGGVHIPIAILAAAGLTWWLRRWPSISGRRLATAGIILLLSATNIRVISTDSRQIIAGSATYPPYQSRHSFQAMEWLREQSSFDDVIWSEVWTGNTLPGVTGRTVALGHGHQTLDLQLRLRDWQSFVREPLSPDERTAMLHRLRVSILWWRAEDAAKSQYQPEQDQRWQKIYANPEVTIYRLQDQTTDLNRPVRAFFSHYRPEGSPSVELRRA